VVPPPQGTFVPSLVGLDSQHQLCTLPLCCNPVGLVLSYNWLLQLCCTTVTGDWRICNGPDWVAGISPRPESLLSKAFSHAFPAAMVCTGLTSGLSVLAARWTQLRIWGHALASSARKLERLSLTIHDLRILRQMWWRSSTPSVSAGSDERKQFCSSYTLEFKCTGAQKHSFATMCPPNLWCYLPPPWLVMLLIFSSPYLACSRSHEINLKLKCLSHSSTNELQPMVGLPYT
jgi:hypothetical protein